MSFFWQSQLHLPKLTPGGYTPNALESGTISSPLRRIHRPDSARVLALSPVPAVQSKYLCTENLEPNEIISVHSRHTDYICGVQKKGRVCKNSFYCRKHSFRERQKVRRSLPMVELMRRECRNRALFAKRRQVTKSLYSCKLYWADQHGNLDALRTCCHTSCSNSDTEKSAGNSPNVVSNSSICEEMDTQWAATLIKNSYIRKITKNVTCKPIEFASYLYYSLECYERLDLEIRVRELEARYEPQGQSLIRID